MATKKPALITRYKAAMLEIEEKNNLIELMRNDFADLEKKLESEKSSRESHYNNLNDRNKEIEQLHCILDNVPNPIPRKTGTEEMPSWDRTELTIATRFGAWLGSR
jgi:hypothetical protein